MFLTVLQVTLIRQAVQHTKSYGFVTLYKQKKRCFKHRLFKFCLSRLESISNTEHNFMIAGSQFRNAAAVVLADTT